MTYMGDFKAGQTVRKMWTTNAAAGGRVDPNNAFEAADVLIYKDGGTTERSSSSGVTLSSSFDSKTGVHHLAIDLSDNDVAGFYAAGHDYAAVLYPDETVDSQTVAAVIVEWSIENRCVNWTQVVGPSTTVDLSGTNIKTDQKVDVNTWKTGTIPSPNVAGVPIIDLKYILGTVLTETAGQIAAAFKKFFDKASPTGTINSLPDAVAGNNDGLLTCPTGNVLPTNSITAAAIATGAIGADALAADAGAEIADALLDRNMAAGIDSGGRTVRNALRPLRNKVDLTTPGTMSVKKEDDTTEAWSASITSDAGAEPITAIDPA